MQLLETETLLETAMPGVSIILLVSSSLVIFCYCLECKVASIMRIRLGGALIKLVWVWLKKLCCKRNRRVLNHSGQRRIIPCCSLPQDICAENKQGKTMFSERMSGNRKWLSRMLETLMTKQEKLIKTKEISVERYVLGYWSELRS